VIKYKIRSISFSFEYLRDCKLFRNLITRCNRALSYARYRCVRISRAGFKKSIWNYRSSVFLKLMRLGNATFSVGFHFLFPTAWAWSTSRFPQLISITNRNYRILGSLWNLSVRTRPIERYVMVQHREASRCVSCGTGVLSSLFVVRHTCTHVALVVLPTFPNITFSRCLVTIAPIIHIDSNSYGNFSRKTTNIAHNSSACDAIINSLYTSLILHLCEFFIRVQSPKV